MNHMMFPHSYGMYPDFGGFFLSLLWWVIIIAFAVWVLRAMRGPRRMHLWKDMLQTHSALDILKERYAKGEISKEEYEERKKVLSQE